MEQTIHGKIPCCIQLSTFTKSQTIKKNTQKAFKFCFCCFPTLGLYISISTFAIIQELIKKFNICIQGFTFGMEQIIQIRILLCIQFSTFAKS